MANRIKETREALKLTRQYCATVLNVDYATFWRWEQDEMLPHPKTMYRLAVLLGTYPDVLFPEWFAPAKAEMPSPEEPVQTS